MKAIVSDNNGIEVLAGLTLDETQDLMEHRRDFARGIRHHDKKAHIKELGDKHELTRLAIIGSEAQRRNDNPPVH